MSILKVKEYINKKNYPLEIGKNLTQAFKDFLDTRKTPIKFGPLDNQSYSSKLRVYYHDSFGITNIMLHEIYMELMNIIERNNRNGIILNELFVTPMIYTDKTRGIIATFKEF